MLKIMQSNKFFSVFLLTVITVMIIITFVFWGIGPRDNPTVQYAAQVGKHRIMLDEYYRAYDTEYRRLRENYSDEEIEKMNLPDQVIDRLIERRILLMAAEEAGIDVSKEELQNAIINNPLFQRNGVFDKRLYERILRLNRTTPQAFEEGLKNDLIIAKMKRLIAETSELTREDLKMLDAIKGENREQLRQLIELSKSTQYINAYVQALKREIEIKINRDLLM